MDLVQGDATRRGLGEVVAARVDNRNGPCRQCMTDSASIVARERGECRRLVDAERREHPLCNRRGNLGAEDRAEHRPRTMACLIEPEVFEGLEVEIRREIGRRFSGTSLEPRAQPVARQVECRRTADTEMGPQHRTRLPGGNAAIGPERQDHRLRDAGPRGVGRWRILSTGRQHERRERRRGCDDGVAEGAGQRVACAIAAAFRQRHSARREDDPARQEFARVRGHAKAAGSLLQQGDAMRRAQLHAAGRCLFEQRVEYLARAVRVGKELAVVLFVQRDAGVCEEPDRVGNRQRAQHAANDRRRPAPIVPFGDYGIGHIAAATAADQDLGARLPCAVEQQH